MNLDDLRTFVTVARAGGVHAASSLLNKTQPAISKSLRRLEEQLGLVLIDRGGYRAKLTDAGDAMLQRAEALLLQAKDLHRFTQTLVRGQEEQLRIAIHWTVPDALWLPLIAFVSNRFPETQLSITREEVCGAFVRLSRGEADLAVSPGQADQAETTQDLITLGELPLVSVWLPGQAMSPSDLPQIVTVDPFAEETVLHGVVDPTQVIQVPDPHTQMALIRNGVGWGRVPLHLVTNELALRTLVVVAGHDVPPPLTFPLFLRRLRSDSHGPVMRALWERAHGAAS